MAKKGRKKEEDVDSYRHDAETRKNAVPVGLASYDTAKPKPKKYDYDPHLDPQLVWSWEKEHISFEDTTVTLYIHKRIALEAIIHSIKREDLQIDLDEDKFELLTSARSLPFKLGKKNGSPSRSLTTEGMGLW